MFKGFFQFIIFSIVFGTTAANSAMAQTGAALTNNIERAHTLLNDVYSELNYNNTVGDVKMHIHGIYRHGEITEQLGASREFAMSGHIDISRGGDQVLRKDTFRRAGEDVITSFYDITDEHFNVTEANEELKLNDSYKEQYRYESLIFTPNLLLQVMLMDASRNSFIATEDKYHIIRHNNRSGNVYFLYINTKTYYLEKIEQPMYDKVSGDYFRTITYSNYGVQDGYQAPGKVVISKDSAVISSLAIDIQEILPRLEYGSVKLAQKKIGDWLYMVLMPEWNCKAVIADMRDFLVVIDPPGTPEAGYALIDNIKRLYPGKEIRYCVVSHQHPERMGGVRPFMEEGTIIVTTEANRSYYNSIALNKHLYSKDVRVKKYITPKFLFVNMNKYELRANERIIQLLLLNKKSYHTDEYIIAYVPSEKLLIESDLVKTWNLKQRTLDRKEKGLVEFLNDQKINVKQVVQTWPLENAPHIFNYEELDQDSSGKLKKVLDVFN